MKRLGRQEIVLLVLIAVGAATLWGFIALADEVVEGETHAFDRMILLALRNPGDPTDPLGPTWFEETARDFTALGSTGVLTLLLLAGSVYLWLNGKRRVMGLLLVAVAGGQVLSTLLKLGFDRPRPDLVPHGTMVYTASFPSGHSMMSAVVYLTLAALLARVEKRRRVKFYLLAMAVGLTIVIGVSRIYLGVHWPTDVLAGWAAGGAWAISVWSVALSLQRRGAVERDGG